MIDQTKTANAFESLSAASELAKMIHAHFVGQADADHPGALTQASGESLAFGLRALIQRAMVDLEAD